MIGEDEMGRTAVPLEKKIENAQQKVVKTKEKYDIAVEELKKLMDKRDILKKEELIVAIEKSNKSYDEIIEFINGDTLT
jgi:hypothetical protein